MPNGGDNHQQNLKHLNNLRESYKLRGEQFVAIELWKRPDGPPFVEMHISESNVPFSFEFYLSNGDRFKEARFRNECKYLWVWLNQEQQQWLLKIRGEQPPKTTRPTISRTPICIMLSDTEFEASISALSPDEQEKAKAHRLYVDARNSRDRHMRSA